jgi:hypothetical protein
MVIFCLGILWHHVSCYFSRLEEFLRVLTVIIWLVFPVILVPFLSLC